MFWMFYGMQMYPDMFPGDLIGYKETLEEAQQVCNERLSGADGGRWAYIAEVQDNKIVRGWRRVHTRWDTLLGWEEAT